MVEAITVNLPSDVVETLNEVARSNGIVRDELVGRALKEHLFLRQFRTLRQRLLAKAQTEGIATDQDVFDRVS